MVLNFPFWRYERWSFTIPLLELLNKRFLAMPLRDDILNPVPGENPCGENLRYTPVYDKIKETRREEDDAPQGEWQRERKTADYPLVIKLAGEALALKSKDLQLAAWLTEALIKTESFAGLRAGLELIRGLIEHFWDNLYPEIEDGDVELRAAPLDWLGSRQDAALRSLPISRTGISWYQYREARSTGYETESDSTKLEAREAAIAEGKMSGEDWDQAFNATPKSFYVVLESTLDSILADIESLNALCGEKFGDDAPSFSPMHASIEEIRHTVHQLLQKKRASEPDEAPAEKMEAEEEIESETALEEPSYAEPEPAAADHRESGGRTLPFTPEPEDKNDAFERVVSIAAFLRRDEPSSATPYLLLCGLRFGELRSAGSELDANMLEAPSSELRQSLKKAANESEWQQVLAIAESAIGLPCGRGWLDAQRYAYRAAVELDCRQIQAAIRAEVNSLLEDYPALREATLLDDTPAANPETQSWLNEIVPASSGEAPEPVCTPLPAMNEGERESAPPDARDRALAAASMGRAQEAIEILTREAAAEKSGRGRFQRRLQLAELCLSLGYETIAHPILEELSTEIDTRGLEGWESTSFVAQPFSLLHQCLEKSAASPELKQKIYDRICRLDPLLAFSRWR
jgi:type VI secretion system protein ImpA